MSVHVELATPETTTDVEAAKALFVEYARSLGFSLGDQDFAAEMADFPGKYGAPHRALLLAKAGGSPVGAVALRLDTVAGQMQAAVRLYRSLGFVDIPAYSASPIPGIAYMELDL